MHSTYVANSVPQRDLFVSGLIVEDKIPSSALETIERA